MIKNRTTSPELEEEIRKSIQENPNGIDPQLMEYAKNLFPNLQTASLPKDYDQLGQQEALDQNPLPENYNELAGQEALELNPLPKNYDQLSQNEAKEQDYELTPEMREYGYKLFGMGQLTGNNQVMSSQIPMVDQEDESKEAQSTESQMTPPQVPEAPAPKQQKPPMEARETQPSPAPVQAPAIPEVAAQPTDVEKMIQQSTEEEDRAALWKQSAKLRDAIMGAGSGTILKTDTSLYEDLEKRAQRPMKNLLLKQELEEKKAKNDPTSNISKLTRKSLEDLGMNMQGLEGVPYSQLEKLYPSLTQALYTKIAADARKEENSIRRSEKADAKLAKLDQDKQKELVKHIDYSVNNLKKAYEQYSKSQTTIDSISNIVGGAKNRITPGTADVTMLYSFISSLDPASTVREGEIALSKSAMSLWGRMKQGTAQLTGGDLLDSATRNSIEEIMKVVQAAREKQFAKQKSNLIEAGVGKGLDKNMLNAYIYPEIDASSVLTSSKKQEAPIEDKLKQLEERLNRNQNKIKELKNKREM